MILYITYFLTPGFGLDWIHVKYCADFFIGSAHNSFWENVKSIIV